MKNVDKKYSLVWKNLSQEMWVGVCSNTKIENIKKVIILVSDDTVLKTGVPVKDNIYGKF